MKFNATPGAGVNLEFKFHDGRPLEKKDMIELYTDLTKHSDILYEYTGESRKIFMIDGYDHGYFLVSVVPFVNGNMDSLVFYEIKPQELQMEIDYIQQQIKEGKLV